MNKLVLIAVVILLGIMIVSFIVIDHNRKTNLYQPCSVSANLSWDGAIWAAQVFNAITKNGKPCLVVKEEELPKLK